MPRPGELDGRRCAKRRSAAPHGGAVAWQLHARVLNVGFLSDDILELIDEVVEIPGRPFEECRQRDRGLGRVGRLTARGLTNVTRIVTETLVERTVPPAGRCRPQQAHP